MSPRDDASRYICVVSDASGLTARRVVDATLTQFTNVAVTIDVVSDATTTKHIQRAVNNTRARRGLIAYTLVEEGLRREIVQTANAAGVPAVDLLGPLMTALSTLLTEKPVQRPGLFSETSREHYDLLDALSFTVRHDDGQIVNDLHLADVVVVGPSRTSKTPLSAYLAHTRGWRVANVPIICDVAPLPVLKQLSPHKVVALTLRADVLAEIRRWRLKSMGDPPIDYAQLAFVRKELRYCHDIYDQPPPWPVVDITNKSIEEIAAEVSVVTVDAAAKTVAAAPPPP